MTTRRMRMMAASLALVLCVSLYSAPKSKAVAVEATAVAIGAAVLSAYVVSTNLDLIGDAAETISNGVTSLVSDWVTTSGVSDSGDSWLSDLGAATQVTSPGLLLLQGIWARECAQFVDWLTETFGLDEDGEEVVAKSGADGRCLYNGVNLPDINDVYYVYTPGYFVDKSYLILCDGGQYKLYLFDGTLTYDSDSHLIWANNPYAFYVIWLNDDGTSWRRTDTDSGSFSLPVDQFVWSNMDVLDSNGVFLAATEPVAVGPLSLTRGASFTNVANQAEDDDELAISTGLADALTLEDFATLVPAQIATGELAPTVELTQTGEGTNPEPDTDDEAVYPYFPVLNGIRDRLDNLGDSIVDGIMSGLKSLVVPDEAFFAEAVPALQETFQGRMGLLTFPISLLADFMGRLLTLSEQDPILRWDRVSLYGTQLIAAGQYNLKDALQSSQVKQLYDIYMIVVNAILIFAFLGLCHNKYRKIMQN